MSEACLVAVDLTLFPSEKSGWRGRLASGGHYRVLGRDPDDQDHRLTLLCIVDVRGDPMRPGEARRIELRFGSAEAAEACRSMGEFFLRGAQDNIGRAQVATSR